MKDLISVQLAEEEWYGSYSPGSGGLPCSSITGKPTPAWVRTPKSCVPGAPCTTFGQPLGRVSCELLTSSVLCFGSAPTYGGHPGAHSLVQSSRLQRMQGNTYTRVQEEDY